MHFESKLGAMVSALHRFTIGKQVHASFAAWKNGATIQTSKHNQEKKGQEAVQTMLKAISNSEKEAESVQLQLQEYAAENEENAIKVSQAEIQLKEIDKKTKLMQERITKEESQAKRSAAESRVKASSEVK